VSIVSTLLPLPPTPPLDFEDEEEEEEEEEAAPLLREVFSARFMWLK
jgi:hypothetical protein